MEILSSKLREIVQRKGFREALQKLRDEKPDQKAEVPPDSPEDQQITIRPAKPS